MTSIHKSNFIKFGFVKIGFILGLLINALAFSIPGFACPNLTGNYSCTTAKGSQAVQLSQEVVNGITIYSLTDNHGTTQVPADNVPYPFEDKSTNTIGTMTYSCENNALAMKTVGHTEQSGKPVSWDLMVEMSLSPKFDLIQATTGSITQDGKTTTVPATSITCARVKTATK